MHTTTIAGLDCIVVPRRVKTGGCVVLLHGYGADYRDLAPLAELLDPEARRTWVFPNAPLAVPIGPHMVGRAWFPIDVLALEQAAAAQDFSVFARTLPPSFSASAANVKRLVDELATHFGCSYGEVVIGGFSQGAMISCEVVLERPANPAALVVLSGALLDAPRWEEKARAHSHLRFFQSHGTVDPLLPFAEAKQLYTLLTDAGAKGIFCDFAGGHEIPPSVLSALADFLSQTPS